MIIAEALEQIGIKYTVQDNGDEVFVVLEGQIEGEFPLYRFDFSSDAQIVGDFKLIVRDGSGRFFVEGYHNGGASGAVKEIIDTEIDGLPVRLLGGVVIPAELAEADYE
jgi:NAD(P)H-dependent FMN reductase